MDGKQACVLMVSRAATCASLWGWARGREGARVPGQVALSPDDACAPWSCSCSGPDPARRSERGTRAV